MENFQDIPEEIKEDIINFLTNKLSDDQASNLQKWLSESEERKIFFKQIADIWHSSSLFDDSDYFDSDNAWKEIVSHVGKRSFHLRITPFLKIAAVLIIIVLSVILLKQYERPVTEKEQVVEMFAPMGSRSYVLLSDGTKVWLNSGSRIKFSNFYGKTTREVKLEGEAYFAVARNKDIPFIVHAADVNITAIGTAFNVKAYPEEGKVETTLEEGSVKIENALQTGGIKAPLFLKPKQKAIYSSNTVEVNNSQTASIKNRTTDQIQSESIQSKAIKVDSAIDTKPFTSWKDNRWIFRHETLHDLARKLERRYDVVITFSDSMIRNYTFSGSLYDESIEQVFEAIKIIAPINFKIKHKEIEISTNEYLKSRYNKYDKLQ